MKTKIALLIDVLEDIKGGAERQVYELVRGLDKEFFEVALYVLHGTAVPDEIKSHCHTSKGLGIKRIYDLKGILSGLRFARELRKNKAHFLMTYHFASDIWGTIWGHWGGITNIVSNRRDTGFWKKKAHILAYKFVNRRVWKVIVNCEASKNRVIADEGVSVEKIEVICNGIDLLRFEQPFNNEQIRKSLSLSKDDCVITSVGNLRPVKGQEYLIEAFKMIVKSCPKARLVLVGDGHLKESLKLKTRDLRIEDKVFFLGKRDDIPEILAASDICVLPSLSEGMSNAILEYMAVGKAVVATLVGGNQELVDDGETGILVKPGNSAHMAKAIRNLISDKDLSVALGEAGKKKAYEEFSANRMIEDYQRLFGGVSKKEIRILHLISSNGLYGAEKVLLSIAENMNSNGVKSMVVPIKNLHNPHSELFNEALKRDIPAQIVESQGRFDRGTVDQLVELIHQNRISIVHSHNYKADFVGLLAARKAQIPIVATNHSWTNTDLKLRMYEFFDGLLLRKFNKVVAVSEQVRTDMLKAGIPATKITVIDNGVPLNKEAGDAAKLRVEFGISGSALIVGCIARLSLEKGHTYLLEAAKKITDDSHNVYFILFGEGPLEGELKDRVKELGLEKRILFAGYRNDMGNVYSAIDVLVQPSLREGLPLSLLEAMSYGKAVIATSVGAVPELITNMQTGLLIKPASVEKISQSLKTLINDSQLRVELGKNAREFVKARYSLEKMISSYRQVYKEVATPT